MQSRELLVASAVLSGCWSPPAPVAPPTVHAANVRSIDPADRDWSDLEPLAAIVGDARVVALGEPSHLDGSAFLAKSRVVEYLHERLHFDVLAWEASLWSCERLGALVANANAPLPDRSDCLGWPWGGVNETRAIMSYARETSASTEPLRVTGFDAQLTGKGAEERLEAWLTDLGRRALPDDADLLARIHDAFARFPKKKKFTPLTAAIRDGDRGAFRELGQKLASAGATAGVDRADLALADRAIDGVIALYDWHESVHAETSTDIDWNHHPGLNAVRDRAMADNVLWLLERRYPGKRVILWTANVHAARGLDGLDVTGASLDPHTFTGYVTMGSLLAGALGKQFVAVAFTAHDGTVGNPPAKGYELPPSPAGSLEDVVASGGTDAAIVDLHAGAVPDVARFIGYGRYRAPWATIFDGAFFLRTMHPATASTP
jgi:erythromycin esterase